jgi:CRISPR-associated protein Cas2
MLFYVICYDIPDDKRRNKISDLLEGYGSRVQYSVFECVLKLKKYQQLQARLRKLFKPDEDNLRFYPLSSHTLAQVEAWGVGSDITQPASSVIV